MTRGLLGPLDEGLHHEADHGSHDDPDRDADPILHFGYRTFPLPETEGVRRAPRGPESGPSRARLEGTVTHGNVFEELGQSQTKRFDGGAAPVLIRDMSDGIIDIRRYLAEEEESAPGAFSLWGGEGERSRFALPLWRIIYLSGGDRGAILSLPGRPGAGPGPRRGLEPLVVLDLRKDPARLDFDAMLDPAATTEASPMLVDLIADGLLVSLGDSVGRRWFVVVDGIRERTVPVDGRTKEDILFLSGECAGLLFFRDLAQLER